MIDQLLDGFAEFDDTSNVIEHEADFLSSVIGTSVENKVSTSIDMIEDLRNSSSPMLLILVVRELIIDLNTEDLLLRVL